MLKIKELSELVGISVRTLHHYDSIGLLCPEKTEAGYRIYSDKDIDCLQQILFFKELDFSLKEIKNIISDPSFNKEEALLAHKKMLLDKQAHISKLVETIDKTIRYQKGEIAMTDKEKFEGFDFSQGDLYEKEAREKWGDKAVDDSKAKIKGNEAELGEKMNAIYRNLASLRHLSPESNEAQAAIEQWFYFLNDMGSYSLEAFEGLGEMYVADERFTKNIDKFGDGLALFMRDAMKIYSHKKK